MLLSPTVYAVLFPDSGSFPTSALSGVLQWDPLHIWNSLSLRSFPFFGSQKSATLIFGLPLFSLRFLSSGVLWALPKSFSMRGAWKCSQGSKNLPTESVRPTWPITRLSGITICHCLIANVLEMNVSSILPWFWSFRAGGQIQSLFLHLGRKCRSQIYCDKQQQRKQGFEGKTERLKPERTLQNPRTERFRSSATPDLVVQPQQRESEEAAKAEAAVRESGGL